jgi:hypothetical protein
MNQKTAEANATYGKTFLSLASKARLLHTLPRTSATNKKLLLLSNEINLQAHSDTFCIQALKI